MYLEGKQKQGELELSLLSGAAQKESSRACLQQPRRPPRHLLLIPSGPQPPGPPTLT